MSEALTDSEMAKFRSTYGREPSASEIDGGMIFDGKLYTTPQLADADRRAREASEQRAAASEASRAQHAEVAARRRYLAAGGTLAGWQEEKASILGEGRRTAALGRDADDPVAARFAQRY